MSSSGGSSSSSNRQPPRGGSSSHAAEINTAMLNVPGYADDSMLFMMRYGALAKETLRKVDWDEFMARLAAMNAHWLASRGKDKAKGKSQSNVGCRGTGDDDDDDATAPAARRDSMASPPVAGDDAVDPRAPAPEAEPDAKAAALEARTLELIQDYAHLVRDFDRFVECTRMMATRYR